MIRTFLVFSLLCSAFYAYEVIDFSLAPGQSHLFSDFNQSIVQPQFANYSCQLSTSSGESSLFVDVFKGTGYVSGSPLEKLEITLNESPLHYFFDLANTLNLEYIPGLLFKNQGNNNINVNCNLKRGVDFLIPQGTEITMEDRESDHYPLQCRLFTLGKNVPLEISTQGNGYIYWGGNSGDGNTVFVNHLEFVYLISGSSTTFGIRNNGNADVDLLCEYF